MTLAPRPLDPDAIRRALHGRLGSPLLYLAETDSTNAQMLALAPAQRRHGTVVITDHQTAGRGRLDRTWIAPPCSSLLFSVALAWPDGVPPAQSVMLAALAVGDAVSWAVEASVQLKWPNDVLIEGKKVCGILGETASGGAGQTVVLGIGYLVAML